MVVVVVCVCVCARARVLLCDFAPLFLILLIRDKIIFFPDKHFHAEHSLLNLLISYLPYYA